MGKLTASAGCTDRSRSVVNFHVGRLGHLRPLLLLVLDEATSSLDGEAEEIISSAIRSLHGFTTVVMIAHRLSTIKNADKIVVINNGVLAEMGNNDELLAKHPNGIYASFVEKQKSSEDMQNSQP